MGERQRSFQLFCMGGRFMKHRISILQQKFFCINRISNPLEFFLFYKSSSLFCQKGKKTKRMPPPFEEHTLCPCLLVIYRKCLVASAAPTAIVDRGLSFFRGPLEFKKPNGTLPAWSDSAAALGVWSRRIVALTLAA